MAADITQYLRARANGRCEYCHIPEAASELKHVSDHIIARQHGGNDQLDNLAFCCVRCNQHKGPNLSSMVEGSQDPVRLFNPRRDTWDEHFQYDGPELFGRTEIGRGTILVLAINAPLRVAARRALIDEGTRFL